MNNQHTPDELAMADDLYNEPVGFLPYSFSILILPIFHHDMSLNALKPCDLI
ncbi:hypothetical protein ACN08N_13465 [Photobacterium leiognathi subsp. mandapamensis]|uniref:hypothetical protein n=1 Tax=Photobacterium leiognathi TaxID=553611 RepID=UPI003AF3CEEB